MNQKDKLGKSHVQFAPYTQKLERRCVAGTDPANNSSPVQVTVVPENYDKGNFEIARFMGARIYQDDNRLFVFNENPNPDSYGSHIRSRYMLKYHKSWSWLMPVVDKIRELDRKIRNEDTPIHNLFRTFCFKNYEEDTYYTRIEGMPVKSGKTPIESVYNAVVDYLKWNQSKLEE